MLYRCYTNALYITVTINRINLFVLLKAEVPSDLHSTTEYAFKNSRSKYLEMK